MRAKLVYICLLLSSSAFGFQSAKEASQYQMSDSGHSSLESDPYYRIKVELAASFRFFEKLGMNEGVANHFSYMTDDDHFIANPFGKYFGNIKASDLVVIDVNTYGEEEKARDPMLPPVIDATTWAIHGNMHKNLGERGKCIFHLHPQYATALGTLEDPTLPPICQNSARFFNRLAHDGEYQGMGLGAEAFRMVQSIGDKSAMLMGNHGAVVVGRTVGQCLDTMYYLEMASRSYITALQTGQKVTRLSDAVAESTAQEWESHCGAVQYPDALMSEVILMLDREGSDFRQ